MNARSSLRCRLLVLANRVTNLATRISAVAAKREFPVSEIMHPQMEECHVVFAACIDTSVSTRRFMLPSDVESSCLISNACGRERVQRNPPVELEWRTAHISPMCIPEDHTLVYHLLLHRRHSLLSRRLLFLLVLRDILSNDPAPRMDVYQAEILLVLLPVEYRDVSLDRR